MNKYQKGFIALEMFVAGCLFVSVGVTAGCIYVICHFISKFW